MKHPFALLILVIIAAYVVNVTFFPDASLPVSVTLDAKPWNDGKVHVWNSLNESSATFTDLPDGTRCRQLDNKTHRLIGLPPPIYYYRVNCDGVIGYVEVDQVR